MKSGWKLKNRCGLRLLLLECELVIPRLFLSEGEAFGRYADVLVGPTSTRTAW
jgi:hypothetical protein